MNVRGIVGIIAMSGLVACGGGGEDGGRPPSTPPPPQFAGSCSVNSGGLAVCTEYVGSGFTASSAQSGCMGTYSAGHCATTGLTGSCAVASSTSSAFVAYYYPPVTLDIAQSTCASYQGVFTLGTVASCRGTSAASIPHGGQETRVRYQASKVPYGSTCVSETQTRTCTAGAWSGWTGTYTQTSCTSDPGSCAGTATACDGLGQTACGAQSGCAWSPASCQATIADFAWNCDEFTTTLNAQTVCNGIPGCSWSLALSSCLGGVQTCSGKTQSACATLKSQNFKCDWLQRCGGTARACAELLSPTTCTAQAGCTWR